MLSGKHNQELVRSKTTEESDSVSCRKTNLLIEIWGTLILWVPFWGWFTGGSKGTKTQFVGSPIFRQAYVVISLPHVIPLAQVALLGGRDRSGS